MPEPVASCSIPRDGFALECQLVELGKTGRGTVVLRDAHPDQGIVDINRNNPGDAESADQIYVVQNGTIIRDRSTVLAALLDLGVDIRSSGADSTINTKGLFAYVQHFQTAREASLRNEFSRVEEEYKQAVPPGDYGSNSSHDFISAGFYAYTPAWNTLTNH